MDVSDKVLVKRCRDGDTAAFGVLVERYQDTVFNLLVKTTASWHDADELTQEAFLRAYSKLGLYDSRFCFRSWLFTIAVNLAKNRFRSVSRRRMAETTAANSNGTEQNYGFHAEERLAEVDEVLAEMPNKLRVPLVLHHLDGFSYEEISQKLHIGVSAAKMRVMRAREEFAHRIDEDGSFGNLP